MISLVSVQGGVAWQQTPEQSYGYAPRDLVGALGFAVAFGGHWGLGVSARYVHQQLLPETSLAGMSFSVMGQYHAGGLDVAAGLANLGGKVGGAALPSSARLAAAYTLTLAGDHAFRLALDGDYFFLGGLGLSAGAEYGFRDLAFLRLGYRYASQGVTLPSHLAFGLGVKYWGVRLDVAYLTANPYMGSSLMAGLSFAF